MNANQERLFSSELVFSVKSNVVLVYLSERVCIDILSECFS